MAQTSIEWLISQIIKERNMLDLDVEAAKAMHRQEIIDFHIEIMKKGLIEEGDIKWTDGYLPKITEMATNYYDQTFYKKGGKEINNIGDF